MSSGTQPRTGKGDEAVRRAPAGSGFIGTQFRICRDGIPACRDAVLANANAGLGGAPGKRRSCRDLPLRNRKGGPLTDAGASALPDAQDCAFLPRRSARVCDSPGRPDSGSGSNTTGMRSNSSATLGRGWTASASAYPRTRPASSNSDGSRLRTVAGAGRGDWKHSPSSFTHFCTTTRRGRVRPGRKPIAIRVNRTLARIDEVLRKCWHHDIREIGAWLVRVWQGWLNYVAVPVSSRLLGLLPQAATPVDGGATPAPPRLEATGAHEGSPLAACLHPPPVARPTLRRQPSGAGAGWIAVHVRNRAGARGNARSYRDERREVPVSCCHRHPGHAGAEQEKTERRNPGVKIDRGGRGPEFAGCAEPQTGSAV